MAFIPFSDVVAPVLPWGRIGKIRSDLELGTLPESEGGTGMAERWFDWCLDQVRPFL